PLVSCRRRVQLRHRPAPPRRTRTPPPLLLGQPSPAHSRPQCTVVSPPAPAASSPT
ncbi:hypothetical protein ACJX0J_029176, partial [Zea mays]